jgi:hypothetical protein
MTGGFFEKLDELKNVLTSSMPVEEKLTRVEPIVRDDDLQREFWNLLDGDEWVAVLKKAGVFDTPPKPEIIDGDTRFHSWGASKFLTRMASRAPSEVASIFAALETENVSVIGDMLDAAAAMPITDAAALVPAVRRAAAAGILWFHFKDASELCVRLANEGEVELSLSLAEALFSPKGENLKTGPSRSDSYWYKEGLKKVTPILAIRCAQAFLPMMCDWLEVLVRSTKRLDAESVDDHSYIWRPAIEEHEQNHDYDLAGVVVGYVREGFEIGIRAGGLSLNGALDLLGNHRLVVFRRLSLHLLAEFGAQHLDVVTETILNRNFFDDHRLKHEYARLVTHQLANVANASRDEWYRWIDEGPDMSDFDENVRQNLRREPTEGDRRSRIDYWKFQKLHWVHEDLEGARREFYERMLAQHGVPEMADLNVRIGSRWGEQSPTTVEHLMTLSFEEAVEEVSSWKPTQVLGPSLDGLLSTFGEYLSGNPEEFSRKAGSIQGRSVQLVSGYLRQMTAAVKAGRAIDLSAVLDLCEWVVSHGNDDAWQAARNEISELIETACQATGDKNSLRFDLDRFRKPFWNLVRTLYRDRSTSYIVRDTRSDDLRVHDYLDLGMNSPRGKAVEAGLEVARWVALHLTAVSGKQDAVPGGIAAIPELAELLEWQVDSPNRTLEAMAIIGSRVGVINWIDPRWLADNADRLFELEFVEDDPATAFGWAAWNAFLSWVRPHVVFYRAFERQFRYAVRQAQSVDVDKQDHDQPMFRLGEHLMVLYGRGQLPLAADVLRQFLSTARPAIRRHAVGFIGSSFGHEDVPSEIVERFMVLWDSYWAGHGRTDAADDPGAVLFGSWFASGKFPDDWALSRLHEYVEVVSVPEPEHIVMEHLSKIAQTDIAKSVRIVERMVKGDREGWRMHGWQEPAKTILEAALKAGGTARTDAEQVIDFLGRRGYRAFGALLAS